MCRLPILRIDGSYLQHHVMQRSLLLIQGCIVQGAEETWVVLWAEVDAQEWEFAHHPTSTTFYRSMETTPKC